MEEGMCTLRHGELKGYCKSLDYHRKSFMLQIHGEILEENIFDLRRGISGLSKTWKLHLTLPVLCP